MLVDAFVHARLFVSELVAGEPGFAVAHEALLRQWPRAAEWIHENRRLLQARKRLQLAAQRRAAEGRRTDHLLNSGRPLSEAREAARRMPQDLDALDHAILRACERSQRQRRSVHAAAALLVVLASASLLLGCKHARRSKWPNSGAIEHSNWWANMLGDLAEQLRTVGNLKLLDSVGSRALRYLEDLPSADMHTGDLINHARALRTTGEVLMNQGKVKAAHAAFTRAAATAEQARMQAPEMLEAHANRSGCLLVGLYGVSSQAAAVSARVLVAVPCCLRTPGTRSPAGSALAAGVVVCAQQSGHLVQKRRARNCGDRVLCTFLVAYPAYAAQSRRLLPLVW